MVSLIHLTTYSDAKLNLQVVTSIMPSVAFPCPYTAFSAMAHPSNFSSSKEQHQTHLFSVDVSLEIQNTCNVACKYPTLQLQKLLSHSSSNFVVYARQSST